MAFRLISQYIMVFDGIWLILDKHMATFAWFCVILDKTRDSVSIQDGGLALVMQLSSAA